MRISKVLIIEDEKLNAERLRRMLKKIRPSFEIVGVLDSILSSIKWIENNPVPDLIMMDIRLSDGLSFEILHKKKISAPIIFTTAYEEYAVQAFKYYSVDYLLKPIEEEELLESITKYEELIDSFQQNDKLQDLVQFLQPKEYKKRFLVTSHDGYKMVLVDEILYFYSELGNCKIVQKNGFVDTLISTLEELEKQLDPKLFFRVNRQFIIHIDSILNVYNHFNGKLKILLKNEPDMEVIVSREKAASMRIWMDS